MRRSMIFLILAVLVISCSLAEEPAIDLDLTVLSGNVLMDQLAEIRSAPEAYEGMNVRVRGQYYSYDNDQEIQRSLIVCETSCCLEVGLRLFSADDTAVLWPGNNDTIEITATIETYLTSYGEPAACLNVHSVTPF